MKPLNEQTELLQLLALYSPPGQNYAELLLDIEKNSVSSDLIVPILGTQGMGKSTLINAILGEDILPNEADETTCVPVEVRCGDDPHGEVYFLNGTDVVIANTKGELAAYVDNFHNPGNEKKVSHIVLYRPHPLLASGMVIVDLPGVGSTTRENEETTNRYIQNLSVAVFIISTSPPILTNEANFITSVWRRLNSAYFVQNVWDDHTEEETEEGMAENRKRLEEISRSISARMSHPIIPVNAYAAARGAFKKDDRLIDRSNIGEFLAVLRDYAKSHREKSGRAFTARTEVFVSAAADIVEALILESRQSAEEVLTSLENEKTRFEKVSAEITELAEAVTGKLASCEQTMNDYAHSVSSEHAELVRAEVFKLIDDGIVDGERLTDAFTRCQTEYGNQALDKAFEELSRFQDELGEILEQIDGIVERETLGSPEAGMFNKAHAFKWEKGLEVVIKFGGNLAGGALTSVGGPVGLAAGVILAGLVNRIGSTARKYITRSRGSGTKRELEPLIDRFREELERVIREACANFSAAVRARLFDYMDARRAHLSSIQAQIDAFTESGRRAGFSIYNLERDKLFLRNWSANDD